MNWKKWFRWYFWEMILVAAILLAGFASRYSSNGFINNGIELIALASGFEGSSELKRRGRWNIRRAFFISIITLFVSNLILLVTHAVPEGYIRIGFYSCFAMLASIFPVAYFLSGSQKRPTPQPATPNAS